MVEDEWKGFSKPLQVKYYVRPLWEYIRPFLESRLSLCTISEPMPIDKLRENDRGMYERLAKKPAFLFFVLEKPTGFRQD